MNSRALAAAFAVTVAIVWTICGLLIMLLPDMMAGMSGNMIHADLAGMQWHMPLVGFLFGGVVWVIVAAITGYLIGWVYNAVSKPAP